MALEVAGEEEVGAKGGDVLRQIPNGNMEVPAQGQSQGQAGGGSSRLFSGGGGHWGGQIAVRD